MIQHEIWLLQFAYSLHKDKLEVHKIASKIIRNLLLNLYKLQIESCRIVNINLCEGAEIKEKVILVNEIREIIHTSNTISLESLQAMSVGQLKGWLFLRYTSVNDIKAYNKINKRALEFCNRISLQIIDEGIEL